MAGLDAVVWVADGQVTAELDYGDRLLERLTGYGLRADRRDLTDAGGAVPEGRLHVLSGGNTSVNDRSTWMPGGLALTSALVEGADRGEHTVMGVCLGSQMIAETLRPGGTRSAQQIEVGLTEVHWRDADGEAERMVVPAFHYEELDRHALAGDIKVVADNDHSPVQGFRYGSRVWGVQFHPEFDPDDMRDIVRYNSDTIEAYQGTTRAALTSVDHYESQWTSALFDRLVHRVLLA